MDQSFKNPDGKNRLGQNFPKPWEDKQKNLNKLWHQFCKQTDLCLLQSNHQTPSLLHKIKIKYALFVNLSDGGPSIYNFLKGVLQSKELHFRILPVLALRWGCLESQSFMCFMSSSILSGTSFNSSFAIFWSSSEIGLTFILILFAWRLLLITTKF